LLPPIAQAKISAGHSLLRRSQDEPERVCLGWSNYYNLVNLNEIFRKKQVFFLLGKIRKISYYVLMRSSKKHLLFCSARLIFYKTFYWSKRSAGSPLPFNHFL